jgi:hypothetical protein
MTGYTLVLNCNQTISTALCDCTPDRIYGKLIKLLLLFTYQETTNYIICTASSEGNAGGVFSTAERWKEWKLFKVAYE